jgi:hypothetical protein
VVHRFEYLSQVILDPSRTTISHSSKLGWLHVCTDHSRHGQNIQLIHQYPSTLSCPCSQVVVPYQTFLSFAPEYHQVCASDFISSTWISQLFSVNTSRYLPLDFRIGASSQFQILATFCSFTAKSVSNALTEFGAR